MTQDLAIHETSRLIASDRVDGTVVYATNGDHLGTIRNFMVDKVSGNTEYAVLQFGGLLGIGANYYPIPWQQLKYDEDKGGYVVSVTREQIEGAPHFAEERPVFDRDYGQSVMDYYQPPMALI